MQSDAHDAVPAASASAPESPLMFVHVFAVAVTLAFLWIHLAVGRVYLIVAPDPWMDKLGREGIELVVFPLAWIAGLLLKWGSSRISALRTSLIAPFLPLLAAGVLALIGLLLALAWDGPASWLGVARWPAAMLIAAAGYVGSILYPRLTAVLAGALVSPTLFGIVAANFISSQLVMYRIANNENASSFILVVAVTVALALLVIRGGGSEIPALFICLDPRCLELCADASPGGVGIPLWGGGQRLVCPITESWRQMPAL